MNILDIFQRVAEAEGISITALERELGASRGVISRAIKQKSDVGSKWLFALVDKYPNYDLMKIIDGSYDIIKKRVDNSRIAEATEVFSLKTDHTKGIQQVPLFNVEARAGMVALLSNINEQVVQEYISIPNMPQCDGAVHVTGDSMYPLLKSGDIVLFKKVEDLANNIFWGEMYLVALDVDGDEYVSVKYVQKSDRGDDFIQLISYNTHHQPKHFHLSHVNAMALVKASVRFNAMI